MHSVTDDRDSRPAWYLPSVADLLFLVILLTVLRRGQVDLLNDPGTPWHVRVGIEVLDSGPPHQDTFSFSRSGARWVSQAWLCDALFAWLYQHWSWNGLVAAAALILAWTYRLLFRALLDEGANIVWSVLFTVLAAGCGAAHWLVRSHLLSFLFFLLVVRWCIAYHRTGSRWLWAIPAIMALWSNVHGGFLAGLVVVGCSLVGHLLSVPRDGEYRRRAIGFAIVLVLASAATLANPYGWELHSHLRGILFTAQVRDLIDEWRAPDFLARDARPLEALLLLTLLLLATARNRVTPFGLIHLLVWVHFALVAVRQVALSSMIVVIALAERTSGWFHDACDQVGLRTWLTRMDLSDRIERWTNEERAAHAMLWSWAVTVLLAIATISGVSVAALGIGSARLSEDRFPVAALAALNRESNTGPLFNDLNWGGYLILLTEPRRSVFVDDRFELYGRDFLLTYLDAIAFGSSWQKLLHQYDFELVLIRPDAPLARALRSAPDWEAIHSDETAILFRRRAVRLAGTNRESPGAP